MSIKLDKISFLFFFIALIGTFIAVSLMPYSKDYSNYLEMFDSYTHSPNLINSIQTTELTYSITAYLTKSLIITSFLLGIVALSIKMFFISKYKQVAYIAAAYYFARFFIVHDVTQVRISFAIGMLLVAYRTLTNRKYGLSFSFFLLAIISHTSTLIYIPVILVAGRVRNPHLFLRKSIKYCLYLVLIVLLTSTFILDKIPVVEIASNLPDIRLYNYFIEEYDFEIPKLYTDIFFFLKLFALLILIYKDPQKKELDLFEEYSRCGIVFLFGLVFFVIFHNIYPIASRLSDIASPFECIVMALFITRLSQPRSVKIPHFSSFIIKILITTIILSRLIIAQSYLF